MTISEKFRLPIQHPDYQYRESTNPYWKKLESLRGRVFVDNDSEAHRGRWREQMASDSASGARRTLHVEVGCNYGHVVLEWAARDPSNAYIGIDWKFKGIHRAAEKAFRRGVGNLIFFRANVERLRYMFASGEVDAFYIFFPDPWPKKAHWKNRFVTAENLRLLHGLLAPSGVLHVKTDHEGYWEWMQTAFGAVSEDWEVLECVSDLHAGNRDAERLDFPDVTLFEKGFIKNKVPIKSLKLRKRELR